MVPSSFLPSGLHLLRGGPWKGGKGCRQHRRLQTRWAPLVQAVGVGLQSLGDRPVYQKLESSSDLRTVSVQHPGRGRLVLQRGRSPQALITVDLDH